MADRVRFGPAGFPIGFKGPVTEVPSYLRNEGLDAFEYQAVRWGAKPRIKREVAEEFRVKARENDIWVTIHGSYFINLAGREDVVRKSIERLKACLEAARWLGAEGVVFHPGFYGGKTPAEALKKCIHAVGELVEYMESRGFETYLRPETTGKPSQLGSLEEILEMCSRFERVEPTIDWAHIHARGGGALRSKDDYLRVFEQVERTLGSKSIENLHFHFTHVEYGGKGEVRHRTLEESYGPSFDLLAEVIVENGYKPVIISESPVLDLDSLKMKKVVESMKARGVSGGGG